MTISKTEQELYLKLNEITKIEAEILAEMKSLRRDLTKDEEYIENMTNRLAQFNIELVHMRAYTKGCSAAAAFIGAVLSWIFTHGVGLASLWR